MRECTARLVTLVCAILVASSGCGGSQASTRKADSTPKPGELAMREPGPRGGPAGPALGELKPVGATAARSEPAVPVAPPPDASRVAPPEPIRVAPGTGKPLALRGRDLVLPGGLILHRVPKGVAARTVEELGTRGEVVELVDARGRRLALVKHTRLSQVGVAGGPSLLRATAPAHVQAQRSDWGAALTPVVIDRFRNDTSLYTLERRADGTDWIPSGLELPGRASLGG